MPCDAMEYYSETKKEKAIKTQNNLKNSKDNVLSQKRQSQKACFLTRRSHGWLERCGVVQVPDNLFDCNINKCLALSFFFFPWVYMCSPSWTPAPTSLPIPSLWVIPVHQPRAPCIMHRTWTDIVHVSMPFSQIILPSPSATESKRLFYISVSVLLSRI